MTKPTRTAQDIRATMAASIKQGMVEQQASLEPKPASVEVPGQVRDKRFTVVIPNRQHRFIKRFAVDSNTDASTIARTLFAMLEAEPDVADRVRSRIHEHL